MALSLLVIGADFSLRERLGALSFSSPIQFCDSLPMHSTSSLSTALFLSPFPLDKQFASFNFHQYHLIGCGGVQHIEAAFALGVRDYLAEPWSPEEGRVRIERLLGAKSFCVPGSSLKLSGLYVAQNGTSILLSEDEAFILKSLILAYPGHLSRDALKSYLWPQAVDNSRVVDSTISRLRKKILHFPASAERVQIRSIRGFGYTLQFEY